MGLESVTYVQDLNELWPLGTDPKSAGDDHIRRIKTALKNTFPNANSVISATPAELNALSGITSNIQSQIDAIATPANRALGALTPAADQIPYFIGASSAAVTTLTSFTRTLLDDANQTAALATLGALIGAVEVKSATFVVAVGDRGKLFDCTGTWTMGLLTASGNSGFAFAVRNSGTGTITVDPSGSELVDGANNIALAAGESCLIVCDGTGWKTVGRSGGVPAGIVVYFAANAAPAGFLKANGAAVSRTTYAALFAAIGTTFGAGDGSTTFNVPELRGEFLRGWADGRAVDTGRVFGSAQAEMVGPHTHPIGAYDGGGASGPTGAITGQNNYISFSTQNNSGTENRPRNIALLACIKF